MFLHRPNEPPYELESALFLGKLLATQKVFDNDYTYSHAYLLLMQTRKLNAKILNFKANMIERYLIHANIDII